MKLSNIVSVLTQLCDVFQLGFPPTFLTFLRSPALLFHPRTLSQIFFSHVWIAYGDGMDANSRQVKDSLLSPNAYGVVLDLGAGHGHTAPYLSRSRVTKYVALEPNVLMHPNIRAMAAQAGFSEESGTLVILSCGAEDIHMIVSSLGGEHCVDTLVSIRTFCSVPEPERTLRLLTEKVLRPKGQLLFYEHVASHRPNVRFWQRFWTPLWKFFFGGCELDRPTDRYIRDLKDIWEVPTGKDDAVGPESGERKMKSKNICGGTRSVDLSNVPLNYKTSIFGTYDV